MTGTCTPLKTHRADVAAEWRNLHAPAPVGLLRPLSRAARVSISTAYWPWAWPSPEPVTLTMHGGRLRLPVRAPREEPAPPPFGPPEWSEPLEVETIEPGRTRREHHHDPASGRHEIEFDWDVGGHRRLAGAGTEMLDTNVSTYRITDGDPTSAEVEVRCTTGLGRGKWQTRVETESRMTSTATEFAVSQRLDAFEGGARIYSRIWELAFPRDGV